MAKARVKSSPPSSSGGVDRGVVGAPRTISDEVAIRRLGQVLADLEAAWEPHPAQAAVLDAIFVDQCDTVMDECGRKFGKSELFAYILWRWALTRPGAYYYIGPLQTQVKEIIWEPGRLQGIGPSKYIKKIDNSDLRITFINGSFIKVDGSDNYQKYRGINPHGACLDEYKDFRPEFWEVFDPNRASFNAPVVIAGTPPEISNPQWDDLAAECAKNPKKRYFNFPTWANPHISREWLRAKKEELYARGAGIEWEREYGARRVYGGLGAIFPMFNPARHVFPHAELISRIERDRHKLEWFVTTDPGTTTVFAVLLSAVNPYTKEIFHLDELYLTAHGDTATGNVIPRLREMKAELYPGWEKEEDDPWTQTYDEAAAWFGMEALTSFGENFMPTHKSQHKKDDGISLIKDQLVKGKSYISDRCVKLVWEIQNYIKNSEGKLPKERDHLIDCYRYANAAAGLSLQEEEPPKQHDPKAEWRGHTIESDLETEDTERGRVSSLDTVFLPTGLEYQ